WRMPPRKAALTSNGAHHPEKGEPVFGEDDAQRKRTGHIWHMNLDEIVSAAAATAKTATASSLTSWCTSTAWPRWSKVAGVSASPRWSLSATRRAGSG